jgi:hypothetical protein
MKTFTEILSENNIASPIKIEEAKDSAVMTCKAELCKNNAYKKCGLSYIEIDMSHGCTYFSK